MRDATILEGQHITYEGTAYTIENFWLIPKGEVYVKLKQISQNTFLNVSLNSLLNILRLQIKL